MCTQHHSRRWLSIWLDWLHDAACQFFEMLHSRSDTFSQSALHHFTYDLLHTGIQLCPTGIHGKFWFFGTWYGDEMPVNSGISPARAFLYMPFTSRASQTSIGASQ